MKPDEVMGEWPVRRVFGLLAQLREQSAEILLGEMWQEFRNQGHDGGHDACRPCELVARYEDIPS